MSYSKLPVSWLSLKMGKRCQNCAAPAGVQVREFEFADDLLAAIAEHVQFGVVHADDGAVGVDGVVAARRTVVEIF
jgi:hypothetical protein